MASFATFGNELYTGKRSYDFVGSKKIWFLIAAVAVALSILLPVAKGGFNLGIEFRGGSEFTVSNVKDRDAALGEKAVQDVVSGSLPRVANVAGNTMRIQTDKLTDDETLQIKEGLTKAYGVTDNEVTSTFVGPTWGADVTKQALLGLAIFVGLAAVLMALYFRTWKMSLSALVGMAVTMFITAGVYWPQRLRSDAVGHHRLPHGAQLLAVRHRGGVRQDPGEHLGHAGVHPAHLRRGGQPRRQPDPGAVHQHHDGGHPAGRRDPLHRGRAARRGNAAGPLAGAVRGHPDRHRRDHLRRGPAVRLAAPGRTAIWSSRPSAWSSAARSMPPRRHRATA